MKLFQQELQRKEIKRKLKGPGSNIFSKL